MQGLMQDWSLLIHRVIDHAATQHGQRPVISRSVEGPIHRTNYAEIRRRALQGREAPRRGRHRLRRPGRDARLEHLAASRGLVRHHRHRRRLPHGQPAAVRGPDRLHHQPRRGPAALPRPHLRAARREDRSDAACRRRALRRADRRGAHAADEPAKRRRPTRTGSRGRRRFRLGGLRREHGRRHVLHLRHDRQPEGRRSTRTARTCCTRSRRCSPTCSACRRATSLMPVVPLFHANGWSLRLLGADGRRRRSSCPGAKLDGPSVYELLDGERVTITRRRADGVARAAAASREDRQRRCPTSSASSSAARPARAPSPRRSATATASR